MDTIEMDYVIDFIKTETECSDLSGKDLTTIAEQYYTKWIEDGEQVPFTLYFTLHNDADDVQKELSYYRILKDEYRYFSDRAVIDATYNIPEDTEGVISRTYYGYKINFKVDIESDKGKVKIESFGNRYKFEAKIKIQHCEKNMSEKNDLITFSTAPNSHTTISVDKEQHKSIKEWYNSEYSASKNADLLVKNML